MADITGGYMDRVNTYRAGSDEDKHNALYKILAALGKGVKTAGQAVGGVGQQMVDDPGLRGQVAKLAVGLTAMDPRNNLAFGNTVVDLVKNQILSEHKAKFDKYLAGGAVGPPPTLSGRSASFIAGEDLSATEKQSLDLMQTMGQIEQARASTKNLNTQTEGQVLANKQGPEEFELRKQYITAQIDKMSAGEYSHAIVADPKTGRAVSGFYNPQTKDWQILGEVPVAGEKVEPFINTMDGLKSASNWLAENIPVEFFDDKKYKGLLSSTLGRSPNTSELLQAMTPLGREMMQEVLPILTGASKNNVSVILKDIKAAYDKALTINVDFEDKDKKTWEYPSMSEIFASLMEKWKKLGVVVNEVKTDKKLNTMPNYIP